MIRKIVLAVTLFLMPLMVSGAARAGDINSESPVSWLLSMNKDDESLFSFGEDEAVTGISNLQIPLEDKWSLRLRAGSDITRVRRNDDFLRPDFHDGWRMSVGVGYKF